MATSTINPTSNTAPDPGQGGLAVTGAVNTGHGVTVTIDTVPPSPVTRTCIWAAFPSVGGLKSLINLRFDWAYVNAISDVGGDGNTNSFTVEYSVNGGGAWTVALSMANVNGSNSGSVNTTIALTQDTTQIQVRDKMIATAGATQSGRIDPSISNIALDVTTVDPSRFISMM